MPVLSSELVKRKKEHVFAEGYEIDVATELTGGISATEEVMHIYGDDDPIIDITVDNATLTINVYDKKENNRLLEALQRIDPGTATDYIYKWDNVYSTTIWANRYNSTNTEYIRSIIYKDWLPVPGMVSGDASARGTRSFAGNAKIPREYKHPILGEKVALTTGASGTSWTAQLSKATPRAVPSETLEPGTAATTLYAIRVVAINEQRDGSNLLTHFDAESLTIDADMVSATGAIAIDGSSSGDLGVLSWATHVYVNYLYDANTGVYPTIKPHGMFENIT
jgi:hypothetical protein